MASPCVLLAQVKCASCGLNLQCANRAYLTRPHWNPTVDRQAIGRLHRPGQLRPVEVIRLVAIGTVDDLCVRRQRRKLACINGLFGVPPRVVVVAQTARPVLMMALKKHAEKLKKD